MATGSSAPAQQRRESFYETGNDWTNRFRKMASDASLVKASSAIFDGEVVVPAANGTTNFSVLQNELEGRSKKIVLVAPDDSTQSYSKKIAHRGIWVEPQLLAEIEYRAKSEGKVRHPFFKGLREDLGSKAVVLFAISIITAIARGAIGNARSQPEGFADQRQAR